jgi:homoserine dehydrogenase
MKKALIIGPGRVGQELARQLTHYGIKTMFLQSSARDKLGLIERHMVWSDIVCLTIPTTPTGKEALGYITSARLLKLPVVTAEKGALANHFKKLSASIPFIGASATVGGGSGILNLLTSPHIGVSSLHGVVNATLNYYFDARAAGLSSEECIHGIESLGLHERKPQQGRGRRRKVVELNLTELLNDEIEDVRLKLAIIGCHLDDSRCVKAIDISTRYLSTTDIAELCRAEKYRFVVSAFLKSGKVDLEYEYISGRVGNYTLQGGFARLSELKNAGCVPHGINNFLTVNYGDGLTSTRIGPGAGPAPTAAAMVEDVLRLLE